MQVYNAGHYYKTSATPFITPHNSLLPLDLRCFLVTVFYNSLKVTHHSVELVGDLTQSTPSFKCFGYLKCQCHLNWLDSIISFDASNQLFLATISFANGPFNPLSSHLAIIMQMTLAFKFNLVIDNECTLCQEYSELHGSSSWIANVILVEYSLEIVLDPNSALSLRITDWMKWYFMKTYWHHWNLFDPLR